MLAWPASFWMAPGGGLGREHRAERVTQPVDGPGDFEASGPLRAFARWALWMVAVFFAHDGRGAEQFEGDIARAVAMALVPLMCQALLAALRASEIIQRRLNSIVQNSTDVVTIVGADQRIRWQAESIRNVLGHAAGSGYGRPTHGGRHCGRGRQGGSGCLERVVHGNVDRVRAVLVHRVGSQPGRLRAHRRRRDGS